MNIREKYTELLQELVDIMSVSGFEKCAAPEVMGLLGQFDFDAVECDRLGNIVIRKSPAVSAPAFVMDAHLDEIGFRVREIGEDGLLSVVSVGGIDTVILPAAEVTVHGKRRLHGVFNVPRGDSGDVKLEQLRIDTGYSAEELAGIVSVGDGVSFRAPVVKMRNGLLAGHAFDDKALAAALILALAETSRESLAFDTYAVISSREEVGGGGAAYAALQANAVGALITDVNFGAAPGVSPDESGRLGAGPMLSLSAVTDRQMTAHIRGIAAEHGIGISPVVEAMSTGTNASHVYVAGRGIPCAVLSLPETGMHTASECISLGDAEATIRLCGLILSSRELAESLAEREASAYV